MWLRICVADMLYSSERVLCSMKGHIYNTFLMEFSALALACVVAKFWGFYAYKSFLVIANTFLGHI